MAIIDQNHPFFNVKKQLSKLCDPLFKQTQFTYFDYERYYFDGNCLFLFLESDCSYQIIKESLLPSVDDLEQDGSRCVFLSSALLSSDMTALQPAAFLRNLEIAKEGGIYHRFCLIFRFEKYIEVFAFGTNNKIKNFFELVINNIKKLEWFCVYFRETGKTLIHDIEKSKVKFYDKIEFKFFNDDVDKNLFEDEFFKATKLSHYPIRGKLGDCQLSAREFECLLWAYKGKTAKQTAKILGLSSRTIEDYLINLKSKLGCESKLELYDIASDNAMIRFFSH